MRLGDQPPSDVSLAHESFNSDVYREMRRIARVRLRHQPAHSSLHATVLANEAYLRLIRTLPRITGRSLSRADFRRLVGKVMQRIIIDHYRRQHSQKRGGMATRQALDLRALPAPFPAIDTESLHDALRELDRIRPELAALVRLRFFANMTMPECAEAICVSLSQAERHWRFARAWLAERLDYNS